MKDLGFSDGFSLDKMINWEQLLDFALYHYNMCEEPHHVCEKIIITYVMNEIYGLDGNYSEEEVQKRAREMECSNVDVSEEIQQRFNKLVTNYIIASLHKKGYVEASIDDNNETVYQINEEKLDGSENT